MRFSIRDLLWATVVVAMGLGWFADSRSKSHKIDRQRLVLDYLWGERKISEEEVNDAINEVHPH